MCAHAGNIFRPAASFDTYECHWFRMPLVHQNCGNFMPNKTNLRAATAASLLVLSTSVWGNTSAIWDGASATWSDGSHWSTNPIAPDNNTPPGAMYDVTVNGGIITLDTSP